MKEDKAQIRMGMRWCVLLVSGASVMVLEILGTRVLAPVFGTTLFVWAALLSSTLIALTGGYYFGGRLADRSPRRATLGYVLVAAGLAVILGIVARGMVLGWTISLGPRLGPLVASLLLFGLPLSALGTVGPIVVRLCTERIEESGEGVGSTYAISTCGSVAGVLLVAFVFIPNFSLIGVLSGVGVLIAAIGSYLLATRRAIAANISILGMALLWSATVESALPEGYRILEQKSSAYGVVQVVETPRKARLMRADHSVIGAAQGEKNHSAFAFTHLLEAIRFVRPLSRSGLVLGLGTGSVPKALENYLQATVDVVELDAAVVELAQAHFGFNSSGATIVEDARTFLRRDGNAYDFILHDLFSGGVTSEHLLSLESLSELKARLREGGLAVVNFVGYSNGPQSAGAKSVYRTLRDTFQHVRVFLDSAPSGERKIGNIIFFASDVNLGLSIPVHARFESRRCEDLIRGMEGWELHWEGEGEVLRDDSNSLARLQLEAGEDYFFAMNRLLPSTVWLHY